MTRSANNLINKEQMYNGKSVERWISTLRSVATDMMWSNADKNLIRQIESIANKLEAEDNDERDYISDRIASNV